MSEGLGLSIGATRLTAVVVGRAALSRTAVLTRFGHRPPEVGVPSENPNLNERGLILTDFVDRVGDPVGIVAADGSTHLADGVLADALRALLLTLTGGRPPVDPVAVTYPAHWRPAAVESLRNALAALPEFGTAPLVSDATAAVRALQDDPGVPTRGVIALCDFGGTGTSVTLLDADAGYAPLAPTVRHTDLSGDLVDQALLTHVINDLSAAGNIDLSGTSAIGSLTRLRAECRNAKERLSTASVTSLMADVPGHRGEVRLTRNELDDAIRHPVTDFAGVLQETLERNGVRELAAIATVGGGARIPIITTTLSDRFRVPIITNGQPELTAAIGSGLTAVRGTVDDDQTAMAAAAAAAAPATQMAPEVVPAADEMAPSGQFGALAWSDANDVPDVAPTGHYEYDSPADPDDVRPQIQFQPDPHDDERSAKALPWYRRPEVALGAGVLVVLVALAAALIFVMRDGDTPPETASTTAPSQPPATSAEAPLPPETQAPPPETATQEAPPPPVTETVTASPTEPPPTTPPPPETTTAPPPPTSEAPPPTTTQPPASTPPPPPTVPTLPYETIPGLPFVPNPIQPPQPAP
ncbi:molecular chaperone [Mycobacterium gallinarum]|uniref:Molecular chaperone n=1 Tax=Mycobacterium gallinarum TaxID=39689 RepID=A0A9W4FEY8_9MYCO|nr:MULTISPECIES: Hsp70 family protein [Mycobacterium]MDV3135374.1 Hsp70 family protein [Mycobacterium sp. 29Ha]BBY92486.1 molecular chaperone [Mycobacterium gallinarum]